MWTDECILRAQDNQIMTLRRPGHKVEPRRRARWSASVHVWGAIGVGFRLLVILDGMVNSEDYVDTLKRFLLNPDLTDFVATNRVLMQDGARPHTANNTMAFLETNNVEVLPWAPYSPDWNCIENVWSIVKRRIVATCFDTKQKLMDATYEAWSSMSKRPLTPSQGPSSAAFSGP